MDWFRIRSWHILGSADPADEGIARMVCGLRRAFVGAMTTAAALPEGKTCENCLRAWKRTHGTS